MTRASFLSFLPLLGLAVACSSIEDQPLSETSQEELVELCEDNKDLFDTDFGEGIARAGCVASLDAQGECTEAALQSCVDERTSGEDEIGEVDCSATEAPPLDDCNLTVGDYLDCLRATVDLFEGYRSLSCGQSDQVITSVPEACTKVQTECPQLFGADDEG